MLGWIVIGMREIKLCYYKKGDIPSVDATVEPRHY